MKAVKQHPRLIECVTAGSYLQTIAAVLIIAAGIGLRVVLPLAVFGQPEVRVAGIAVALVTGMVIFLIAMRVTTANGALLAILYFALLPLSIRYSQEATPALLGIAGLTVGIWSFLHWIESGRWEHALIGGIFFAQAALAAPYLLTSEVAFLVGLGLRARQGSRNFTRNPWWIGLLSAMSLAGLAYIAINGVNLTAFNRLFSAKHYFAWAAFLNTSFDLWLVFLSLWGLLVYPRQWRWFPVSLWAGYVFLGISSPAAIVSQPALSIGLVLTIGLSLAPLASVLIQKGKELAPAWKVVLVLLSLGMFIAATAFAYHEVQSMPEAILLVGGTI